MTRAALLLLLAVTLSGCAFLTPAVIGGALGLGAATINLDTQLLHWYLCNRGENPSCKKLDATTAATPAVVPPARTP